MLRRFTYHEPKSMADAIDLLYSYGSAARLIAGGTDLIVKIKHGKDEPDHVISLRLVPGLDEISFNGGELRIGAMTTHSSIARSQAVRDHFSLLADAVENIGSVQVRNLATIGGNICNAAPSADTAAPLVALDAELLVEGPDGEKKIDIKDFYLGPNESALAKNEILKEIIIPELPVGACSRYVKYSRRKAMDLPLLGMAVVVVPDSAGATCKEARIGLTLAAPTPLRTKAAEEYVTEKPLKREIWKEAGAVAVQESSPRTSFRTTADYRKRIIGALLPRVAFEALERRNEQK